MEILPVTLNPSDMGSGFTLSNGNLTYVSATDFRAIRATHGKQYGKWYWEVRFDAGVRHTHIGISNKSFSLVGSIVATSPEWRTYYGNSGNKYPENTAYSTVWDVGNIVGVALDLDNGTLEFFKNGVSMGISHTNVKTLGEVYPTLGSFSGSSKTVSINFGASPFSYQPPSGFLAFHFKLSYKILLSSNNGVYSLKDSVAYKLSVDSEKNYHSYGADSISSFNGYLTKMKDIKNTSIALGSGKTFEHTVAMSKRRVDKIKLG